MNTGAVQLNFGSDGVAVAIFPELCLTGYSFRDRAELEALAVNPLSSDFVQELIDARDAALGAGK